MTRRKLVGAVTIAALIAAGGSAAAGEIQNRKERQQGRIAEGVESGQLTAGETVRLEHKEACVNREERSFRRENGGTLTPQERRTINRQQNRLSRDIYRDKHNGRTR